MGSGRLVFSHGDIILDGNLLPGVLKSLNVRGDIQFDDAGVDSLSGKSRTNMGWNDAYVDAIVELLSDDERNCYAKLALLNVVFQAPDENGNPKIYTIVNSHTIGRRISGVIFAGLDSGETDQDDVIEATLSFVEHAPYTCEYEPGPGWSSSQAAVAPTLMIG